MVTICYEHLTSIRDTAPQDGFVSFGAGRELTADQAVAGGIARLVLYETSFAVFDVLKIPVWGRIDEAADNVTALIMLDFGEEMAWTTILGSAWYLAQRGLLGTGFFSDAARPLEAQRFYNYLCFAYGAQPKSYEFLVNGFNLPPDRATPLPRGGVQAPPRLPRHLQPPRRSATDGAGQEAQELAAAMSMHRNEGAPAYRTGPVALRGSPRQRHSPLTAALLPTLLRARAGVSAYRAADAQRAHPDRIRGAAASDLRLLHRPGRSGAGRRSPDQYQDLQALHGDHGAAEVAPGDGESSASSWRR